MNKAVFVGELTVQLALQIYLQISNFRRLRNIKDSETKYELNLNSFQVSENGIEVELLNNKVKDHSFKLSLTAIKGNIFRLQVDEVNALHNRYRPQYALNGDPQVAK